MRYLYVLCLSLVLLTKPFSLWAGLVLFEGFDNVSTLTSSGWVITNNSTPGGNTSWLQGTSSVFPAQSGVNTSAYVAANYYNTVFGGNISNWLISPQFTWNNGDVIGFFTRTEANSSFPDALEVRLSTSGASTDVGTTVASTGVFTNLLLSLNPTLTVGGYPIAWTQETITLSGLSGPVTGRFAFHYALSNTSTNGDYIGIDTLSVTSTVPEPGTTMLFSVGGVILAYVFRKRNIVVSRR